MQIYLIYESGLLFAKSFYLDGENNSIFSQKWINISLSEIATSYTSHFLRSQFVTLEIIHLLHTRLAFSAYLPTLFYLLIRSMPDILH